MAHLTLTRISGDPDALLAGYLETEPTMTAVGRDHGLIAHAAARTDDGLLVVNLWPSPDRSAAAAADARRAAVIAHHGLTPAQFHREHHEVARHVVFG